MKELLSKLIERGWKPRNKDYIVRLYIKYGDIQLRRGTENRPNEEISRAIMSKRELVSRESGLWQFVCKNDMVDKKSERYYKCFITPYEDANDYEVLSDLEYRLIESALKDESELEDFLLSNIKVEG